MWRLFFSLALQQRQRRRDLAAPHRPSRLIAPPASRHTILCYMQPLLHTGPITASPAVDHGGDNCGVADLRVARPARVPPCVSRCRHLWLRGCISVGVALSPPLWPVMPPMPGTSIRPLRSPPSPQGVFLRRSPFFIFKKRHPFSRISFRRSRFRGKKFSWCEEAKMTYIYVTYLKNLHFCLKLGITYIK